MSNSDQALSVFKNIVKFPERQCRKKVAPIRSNNRREYMSREFETYLSDNGIKRQLTEPYTLRQNGIAEWKIRTLVGQKYASALGKK